MIKYSTFLPALFILFFTDLPTIKVSAQPESSRFYRAADGTHIYYEVKGSGYPVVLVHGFIVNSSTWKITTLPRSVESRLPGSNHGSAWKRKI